MGDFVDSSDVGHAFLLSGGTYTVLDYPGSSGTYTPAINESGQIVGSYTDSSGYFHGFLLSGGTYTSLGDPDRT